MKTTETRNVIGLNNFVTLDWVLGPRPFENMI